jgi:hypothetical protein
MSTASLRERLDVALAHSRHLGSAEQAEDAVKAVLTWLADSKLRIVPEGWTKEMANRATGDLEEAIEWTRDSYSTYIIEQPGDWANKAYKGAVEAAPSNASALGMEDSHDGR